MEERETETEWEMETESERQGEPESGRDLPLAQLPLFWLTTQESLNKKRSD